MKNIVVNGETIPFYLIDEKGNLFTELGAQMTQFESNNGYMRVKLSRGVKRGMYLVHRIVAETFIENPQGFPIVHHKDDKRSNNSVSNLEWCNNAYNQKQRYKDGKHKGTKTRAVIQHDPHTLEPLQEFESLELAEKATGARSANISKVCRGQRKTAGGYTWQYK